jgi:hypothetical protein
MNLQNGKVVIRAVIYVKGSDHDNWHWCENCTQYPLYVHQKAYTKPISDLCEQCEAKEENEDCHCEELKHTEPQLKREVSNSGRAPAHHINKRKALPPMPVAPHFSTRPPEPTPSRELYWNTNTVSPSNAEETKLPILEKDSEKPVSAETQIQGGAQIGESIQIEKPCTPNQRMEQSSSEVNPCPHNIDYFSQSKRSTKIPETCFACKQLISCVTRPSKRAFS